MNRWNRTLPFVALALAASTALIGPATPAVAAETATAVISEVTCIEEDGQVTVTVAASDTEPATFLVLVDGEGGEEIALAAGETQDVVTTALEDGDRTFEAILMTENGEEVGETLVFENRAVLCDAAPEGPYSNARGEVMDSCEGTGWVTASNKPIGGNTEDLKPVTFRVTFTPTDDEVVDPTDGGDGTDGGEDPDGGDGTDGGEDPGDGDDVGGDGEVAFGERAAAGPAFELTTFVLDATTPTYDRTFSAEELGSTGDLFLWVGEEMIASAHIGYCQVLALESSGGGPAVVNTGA